MANVRHGPDFQYVTDVLFSTNDDNVAGSCGIHNIGGSPGTVNVQFNEDEGPMTLYLRQGGFAFCRPRRILPGGTIAESDVQICY